MADGDKGIQLAEIARHFDVRGTFASGEPYGSGHINDTYAAWYDQGGTAVRYIHQRINSGIFKDPVTLMENIKRVTEHTRNKLLAGGAGEITRKTLTLIPTPEGEVFYVDDEGNFWRTYIFIEKARTYDQLESPPQAFEAAKSFGAFQAMLADLPAPRLSETIPDFHNTPKRFEALMGAIERDSPKRADGARQEIEFALERKERISTIVDRLQSGDLPERITHNDTKLNNVMIDDATGEGICVIDLDTVMPGCALYDFGDMVRSATNSSMEDEPDVSKVCMRMDVFEALVKGYLESAGTFLTASEKELLVFSGRLITFEIGLRFLSDYLEGDVYFKTHREGQNLDRCRVQFALLASMEAQEEQMEAVVDQCRQ